jgi:hypothetical protein
LTSLSNETLAYSPSHSALETTLAPYLVSLVSEQRRRRTACAVTGGGSSGDGFDSYHPSSREKTASRSKYTMDDSDPDRPLIFDQLPANRNDATFRELLLAIPSRPLAQQLADGQTTHLYIESHRPTYEEERDQLHNLVLGLPKVDPLVATPRDPVTIEYCKQSHEAVCETILALDCDLLTQLVKECAWFRLEISGLRPVCVDRYHLDASIAIPLWDTARFTHTLPHERCLESRNVPALLLRRILRTEIAQARRHRILDAFVDLCQGQEYPRWRSPTTTKTTTTDIATPLSPNTYNSTDTTTTPPDLERDSPDPVISSLEARYRWPTSQSPSFSRATRVQLIDLQFLLAPFVNTAAFLFPCRRDREAVTCAVGALRGVLGRWEFVFDAYKIPPPSCPDYISLLELMERHEDGRQWYAQCHRRYQFYTTVLWRLVKAHRLQAALNRLMAHAGRSQYHSSYCYDTLKLIEYRVQLLIDTHLEIYAYACGDAVWTDGEWLCGPGLVKVSEESGREYVDLRVGTHPNRTPKIQRSRPDVTRQSPIMRFYPHCRNVRPCESELPDVSTAVVLGNLRYDVNVKPAQPTLRQALIHLFACKLTNHRCLIRNFADIILRYINGIEPGGKRTSSAEGDHPTKKKIEFRGYPSLKEFVMLAVRCGMLGNWKMCDARANFARRIELEYAFMRLVVPLPSGEELTYDEILRFGRESELYIPMDDDDDDDAEEGGNPPRVVRPIYGRHPTQIRPVDETFWVDSDTLTNWIKSQPNLCLFLMREYYTRVFERCAVDVIMHRNLRWGRFKHLCWACMDNVRDVINKEGGVLTPNSIHEDWMDPLNAAPDRILRWKQLMRYVEGNMEKYQKLIKNCFVKLRKAPIVRMLFKQMNAAENQIMTGYLNKKRMAKRDLVFYTPSTFEADSSGAARPPPVSHQQPQQGRGGSGARHRRRNTKKGADDEDDVDDDEDDDDDDDDEESNGAGRGGMSDDDDDDGLNLYYDDEDADDDIDYEEAQLASAAAETALFQEKRQAARDRNLVPSLKYIQAMRNKIHDVDFDLMDMVARDVMRRHQSLWRVETRHLVELFGVSLVSHDILRRVYTGYEAYDHPDFAMIKRLARIYVISERDFNVIRLYLAMLIWHSNQLFIALPNSIRWRQLVALRRRWSIPEERRMPEDIGWGYFCPGNRRWYTTEIGQLPVKIYPEADRERYLRDLDGETPAKEALRLESVQRQLSVLEKNAERCCWINMMRVSCHDGDGKLYAKRRIDPSLRRLQRDGALDEDDPMDIDNDSLAVNIVELAQEVDAEYADGLEQQLEVDRESAERHRHELDTQRRHGTDENGQPMEVFYANGDFTVFLNRAKSLPPASSSSIVEPSQSSSSSSSDPPPPLPPPSLSEPLHMAWLSDEARARYRETSGKPYLYDSRCIDPLAPIDLVGVLKYMNDKLYGLCVRCGCIMHVTSARFQPIGPVCGSHDEHASFKRNQRFLKRCTRLPELPSERIRQLFSEPLQGATPSQGSPVPLLLRRTSVLHDIRSNARATQRADGGLSTIVSPHRFGDVYPGAASSSSSATISPQLDGTPSPAAATTTSSLDLRSIPQPSSRQCIFCRKLGTLGRTSMMNAVRCIFTFFNKETQLPYFEIHYVCQKDIKRAPGRLRSAIIREDRRGGHAEGNVIPTHFNHTLTAVVKKRKRFTKRNHQISRRKFKKR